MSYHITAKYSDDINDNYTCDNYVLSLDDLVMYKSVGEAFEESGTISFRNKNFIGLEIEKIDGLQ